MKKIYALFASLLAASSLMAQDIITEVEGTNTYYSRVSYGWYIYAGGNTLQYGQIPGPSSMVRNGDDLYILNPLTANETDAYIKCSVEGDKITAQFPQAIDMIFDGATEIPLYIGVLDPVDYTGTEQEGAIWYEPVAENNTMTWTIQPDGTVTMDHDPVELDAKGKLTDGLPSRVLGTYYYVDNGEGAQEPVWNAVGDWEQTYTPVVTYEEIAIPEGLAVEAWQMTTKEANRMVDVAIDGTDIYIGSLTQFASGAIKGYIDGDKVFFPTLQYMGFNTTKNTNVWFISAIAVYEEYDFGGGTSMTILKRFDRTDALEFAYDAEKKTLTSVENGCFVINSTESEISFYEYQVDPKLTYLSTEGMDAEPLDPVITVPGADMGSDGYYFECIIPSTNVNGVVLNTDQMYYNIYINGALYTFYTDTYYRLKEDMTNVPYNFTENWDFDVRGETHGIYFHAEGIESIGIVSCFKASDGTVYKSARVSTDDNGIGAIEADKTPTAEEWYTLQGMRVTSPQSGVYVRVTTYADGSRKSQIVKR